MKGKSEQDLRKSQYRLLIFALLIIFIAILVYTVIWELDYHNRYGFFKKTIAEVVDHEVIGTDVYDVIEYNVESVNYRKTTTYLSKNQIGDIINIYYDEANPIGIVYSIDSRVVALPIIATLFGVVCLCFIVTYFWIFKSTSRSITQRNKKSIKKAKNNKKDIA